MSLTPQAEYEEGPSFRSSNKGQAIECGSEGNKCSGNKISIKLGFQF